MKNVEDIYPLSPLQQGMLFHTLLTPDSGVYVNQCSCTLHGELDQELFRQTWQKVIERHPILRTAFLWEGLDEPVQVVRQQVKLAWEEQDWHDLPAAEQAGRLAALRAEDRQQPLPLAKAPLMRFRLIRLAAEAHAFLWTFHHILLDGWSTPVLLQEVFAIYAALHAGKQPDLPARRPFRDYIAWLGRQDKERLEAFWRRRLDGLAAPTSLAIDRPAAATAAIAAEPGAYEEQGTGVPQDVAAALQALASRSKLTLNTVVLGAWALLLGRYSGGDDVVFGAVVSGRPVDLPGVESIVGLFINTLPVRVRVLPAERLMPWLQGVQAQELELRQYEYSPLVQVQKWSPLPPAVPLFESIFVFENYPLGESRQEGEGEAVLRVSEVRASESTGYPMTLSASAGGSISLRATYDRSRFEPGAVRRMLGHLAGLLTEIAAAPDRRVADLPLLGEAERLQIAAWNDTRVAYPLDRCLHERIEDQVDRAPGSPAVTFEDETLTYRELDVRANRLARRLGSLGVGPEGRVGVLMERSIELVVALLGILKAGAAYVPLDPEHPADRLAYQVDQARVPVVLAQERLLDRLVEIRDVRVLRLDAAGSGLDGESGERPAVRTDPGHPAYVLFTSGSTGRPKGVVVSHRAISNRLLWMQEAYGLTAEDRVLQKTPFSFDVSVWEFFWPLLAGAQLVVARPGGHRDNAYMARLIQESGITVMHFVPSMLQLFVEEPEAASCRSLRDVMASGEALPPELAQRFFARLPGRLHNLYGPTEAAVDVTSWTLDRDGKDGRSVPIGRPIANTRIHLLDPWMGPVPVDVPGELYIAGVNLARGYVERPDLTAERFLPDPLAGAEEAGSRLYRTGDLARWRGDGAIEYLGRTDHQVKVRGFRIELGEIEAALAEHPQVREAVVTAQERADGHRRLVAYVAGGDGTLDPDSLRSFLGRSLPDYMVPALFVPLDALPLTSSGKVDRRALPEPEAARPDLAAPFAAPEGPAEEALAGIWAGVLKVDRVGRDDNFFALGGDSMLSIQVLSQARERGLGLSLQQLFQHQTVRALAQAMAGPQAAAPAPVRTAPFSLVSEADRLLLPDTAEDAYPLAKMQAGMLFHSELNPDSSIYHNTNSIYLKAPYDPERMRLALDRLASRHPLLRTSFDLSSFSEPLQIVHREVRIPLLVEDLRHLAHAEQEEVLAQWFQDETHRLFDWRQVPLLRFSVRRRDEEHVQFSWSEHHAILDGWSVASLIAELTQDFMALIREGAAAPQPATPVSLYRDYVALERQVLASEEARRYWLETLWDATLIELPHASGVALDTPPRLQTLHIPVSKEVSDGLNRLARAAEAPIKSLLLAAHLRALGVVSGQPDLVTGVVANGRLEEPDGERVLGLFLNTLPLRFQFAGGTWIDLAQQAFAAETESLPYRLYPLAEIQRLAGGRPLFDTAFTYMNFHVMQSVSHLSDEVHSVGSQANIPTNYPLSTYFTVDSGTSNVGLFLDYDASRLEADLMQKLAGYYGRALAAMAEHPESRYDGVALLSETEQHQILAEWNRTGAEYSGAGCLHELFEAQVERTPEAPAVSFEGEELTYRQLNERVNRLAHRLRRLGVAADSRVGVCLERSLDMVAGLYAVLKAGGAYVPLDPTYPADRLSFMLRDAGVPVLLTHERFRGLVPAGTRAVFLDAEDLSGESPEDPARTATPDNLAYVIYTSGSTGMPKGTMNTHRAVRNRILWMQDAYRLTAADRVLQKTPYSFDVSVWEFFWPLLTGARLVVARPEGHKDPGYLAELIAGEAITTIHFVPSMLRAFLEEPAAERCTSLARVFASGEALGADLVRRFFERLPAAGLHNLYGPTEAAVDVTSWACDPAQPSVPIGRPIANVVIYLLDRALGPVPVGAPGELFIGGVALARGYHARPDLTAERFVPHPFSAEPGARLYRTGDLARFRPEGEIEYLGRLDHQVKLRGFRIELGEIEAALRSHPGVRDAAVLLRHDDPGDPRIIAYTVPAPEQEELEQELGGELAGEQVAQWQMVFDRTYEAGEAHDPSFNIAGWTSSYTGEPIPAHEMREWVDSTVDRILSRQPESVLEIGCGTGLLLHRIAPRCARYWATDLSAAAVAQLRPLEETLPGLRLFEREAADFSEVPEGSFDAVVLNSVVQYFPGVDYLLRVLEGAVRAVRDGGFVFLGDVRSLPLLEVFHASVELERAPAALPLLQVRRQVQARVGEDEELVLDPTLFTALRRRLPRIGGVRMSVKRGHAHNELTRFRYDVVLEVGEPAPVAEPRRLDWSAQELSLDSLRQILLQERPEALAVTGVPNARLLRDLAVSGLLWQGDGARTLGELREALPQTTNGNGSAAGVDPEELWSLAEEAGYAADISWQEIGWQENGGESGGGRLEALFWRGEHPPRPAALPAVPEGEVDWSVWANDPLRARLLVRLLPRLRDHLQERLPEHMVPSSFVLLDALPLTPSGKLDRRALPAPEQSRPELARPYVAPRTPTEETLVRIWQEVLKLDRVGIEDDLFEIGGHSLLATQIVARVRQTFQIDLPLRALYDARTISSLAVLVVQRQAEQTDAATLEQLLARVEQSSPPLPLGGAL